VYTGIEGPFTARSAHHGCKYLIGFIDAKTHEGVAYGMHDLNEVWQRTVEHLAWVRNQRVSGEVEIQTVRNGTYDPVGYTTLQADSHSVYRNDKYCEMVREKFGCKLQYSPPYDQHRNGMIERWWRTTGCRAKALLFAQELPNNYWYWAYMNAARCHNLIGTSANPDRKSPHEMKTGPHG
jgi:hypothetical protein